MFSTLLGEDLIKIGDENFISRYFIFQLLNRVIFNYKIESITNTKVCLVIVTFNYFKVELKGKASRERNADTLVFPL